MAQEGVPLRVAIFPVGPLSMDASSAVLAISSTPASRDEIRSTRPVFVLVVSVRTVISFR